jgi:hypothetical protein
MPCHASCFFHGAIKTCIELQTQTDKKGGKLFESNSKEKEKQHPNNRVAKNRYVLLVAKLPFHPL